MTLLAVSRTFTPNDMGGYDISGTYFPSSTAVVTNGLEVENVFATFSYTAAQYMASLVSPTVYLNFTLSNADYVQTQPVTTGLYVFLSADDQDAIESNRTNSGNTQFLGSYGEYGSGNLFPVAGNYYILNGTGNDKASIKGGTHDFTFVEYFPVYDSFASSTRDLYAAFQVGRFPSDDGASDGYLGLTKVSNVSLIVTGITYINVPVISHTAANQPVLDDILISPFSSVTLSDPSNPNGFGDIITIVITDASGAATDAFGTLTLPTGSGLIHNSAGTYRLTADGASGGAGIAGLQAELNALVFSPFSLGDDGAPAKAKFTLNYRAIDGTPATDTTTSVLIKHDTRTVTLSNSATGTDKTPFAALKGFSVVDPYNGDQVGATIFVQAGTGTLSGSGLTQNADGTYSLAATSVATLNSELQALLFTATQGRASPGSVSTAEISINVSSADGWNGSGAESVKVTALSVDPKITGSSNIRVKAVDTSTPFNRAVLTDTNYNSSDTLTIQLSDGGAGGTLSGRHLFGGPGGTYKLYGTASEVTADLQGLVFTPSQAAPNSSVATTFTLSDTTAFGTSTTSSSFSVTAETAAVNPTITGGATLTVQSEAASTPFANATVSDPNVNSSDTLTIQLSNGGAGGALSGAGLSGGAGGSYTLNGTGAQVTAALRALVFTPSKGNPGGSTTTTFTLKDKASVGNPVASTAFSVTNTDPAVAPTLTGGAAIKVQSEAASTPFATATLSDPNFNSVDTLTIQLSNAGKDGKLSGTGLSGGTGGAYTLTGTAAAVTAALQALVFTPSKGAAGTSATTSFTLTDTATSGATAVLAGFSVTNVDPLFATGAVFNPGPVNNTTIDATSAGQHTVIIGAGNQNTITYGGSGGTVSGTGSGNTVTGGNSVVSVSGLGGGTTVVLGDGNNTVNLAAAGASNSIVVGNGNNRIAAGNGGGEQVTAGNGANTISAGGTGDIVMAGNGGNSVTMTGALAVVTTGSGNDSISIVGVGGATIRAGLGTNKISFAGTGNVVVNQGGSDFVSDSGAGNTIVTSVAGSGVVTIGANALTNGDVFDLRATMAATSWNHMSGTLGSYLSTGVQGNDATILIRPTGTALGGAYTVAVLTGAGPTSLSTLLPHTLT